MATSPDDNSGITKLDGSPVPEEINSSVFLCGAFMCHNIMTSAYNLIILQGIMVDFMILPNLATWMVISLNII